MKTNKYIEELNATSQLDNTARISTVRKNIARIQTIITEKKLNNKLNLQK